MNQKQTETPVRVGVFATATEAADAVRTLLNTGFSRQEITVIGPSGTETWLKEFEHQEPAGDKTPAAAAAGGVVGAAIGGGTVLAAGALAGVPGLVVASGLAAWTGAVAGGLFGAMMTRGFEKEAANYYDQAVRNGQTLVAVEIHDDAPDQRLAEAARILAQAGAKPMRLPEG
jgi:outer membrane lipoprotein SlyB